ncbi:unnamed protein product [Gadus morhua 'NCC']
MRKWVGEFCLRVKNVLNTHVFSGSEIQSGELATRSRKVRRNGIGSCQKPPYWPVGSSLDHAQCIGENVELLLRSTLVFGFSTYAFLR